MPTVPSPCNGLCRINRRTGLCEGCFRTTEEIGAWTGMPDERRYQLLQTIERRQTELIRFD